MIKGDGSAIEGDRDPDRGHGESSSLGAAAESRMVTRAGPIAARTWAPAPLTDAMASRTSKMVRRADRMAVRTGSKVTRTDTKRAGTGTNATRTGAMATRTGSSEACAGSIATRATPIARRAGLIESRSGTISPRILAMVSRIASSETGSGWVAVRIDAMGTRIRANLTRIDRMVRRLLTLAARIGGTTGRGEAAAPLIDGLEQLRDLMQSRIEASAHVSVSKGAIRLDELTRKPGNGLLLELERGRPVESFGGSACDGSLGVRIAAE